MTRKQVGAPIPEAKHPCASARRRLPWLRHHAAIARALGHPLWSLRLAALCWGCSVFPSQLYTSSSAGSVAPAHCLTHIATARSRTSLDMLAHIACIASPYALPPALCARTLAPVHGSDLAQLDPAEGALLASRVCAVVAAAAGSASLRYGHLVGMHSLVVGSTRNHSFSSSAEATCPSAAVGA